MVGHGWRVPTPLPSVRPHSAPADSWAVALVDPATGADVGAGWMHSDGVWIDPEHDAYGVAASQPAVNHMRGATPIDRAFLVYSDAAGSISDATTRVRGPVVVVPSDAAGNVAPALAALAALAPDLVRVAPELRDRVSAVDLRAPDVPTIRARVKPPAKAPAKAPAASPVRTVAPSVAPEHAADRSPGDGTVTPPTPLPGRLALPVPRLPPRPALATRAPARFGAFARRLSVDELVRLQRPPSLLGGSDPLVPLGCVTLLAAYGGSGKGWVAISIAVALALADHPTLHHAPAGVEALRPNAAGASILAMGDDDESAPQARELAIIRAVVAARRGAPDVGPHDPDVIDALRYTSERIHYMAGRGSVGTAIVSQGPNGHTEGPGYAELLDRVREVQPAFVVIDSVMHFAGADRDDSALLTFYALCARLASEHSSACMVIHHMRKRGTGDHTSSSGADDVTGSAMHASLAREVWTLEALYRMRADLTDAEPTWAGTVALRTGVKVNEGRAAGAPPVWLRHGARGPFGPCEPDVAAAIETALRGGSGGRSKARPDPDGVAAVDAAAEAIRTDPDAARVLALVRACSPFNVPKARDRLCDAVGERPRSDRFGAVSATAVRTAYNGAQASGG